MEVQLLDVKGTWRSIADSARTTINLKPGTKEPSSAWKRRMLLCEHSPTRKLILSWKWINIKSWVSVHFVRHKFGIEHWISTRRTDRTGINRDELKQAELIVHECEGNAQAIINISRKRLCVSASPETRIAWKRALLKFRDKEPELYQVCVPDCIYRGWCFEYTSCGFHRTPGYLKQLHRYRENINGWEQKI